MDALHTYASDSDEERSNAKTQQAKDDVSAAAAVLPTRGAQRANRRHLKAAPAVALTAGRSDGRNQLTVYEDARAAVSRKRKANESSSLLIMNNPQAAVLYQPTQGPQAMDPAMAQRVQTQEQRVETNVAFDDATFQEQRLLFQRTGRAAAPDAEGTEVLRTTLGYHPNRLEQFAAADQAKQARPIGAKDEALVYGSDDEAQFGVWAPPSSEERWAKQNEQTDLQKYGEQGLAPEQLAERAYIKEKNRQKGVEEEEEELAAESSQERLVERKMSHLLPPQLDKGKGPMEASTTFHGGAEFDYKGKSWMAPPAGLGHVQAEGPLGMDHHKCYIPKKCLHRFTGHNQGVHRIRLFPLTGHLLLSAGLDGKCKVWSIAEKQCMRTYVGHAAAVRDVEFNHDGTAFVSASFDRYLRLWNTETGEVKQTFTNGKMPYVVKFYPHDDNLFVAGCSDNKIVAYDCTTGEVTQEYNHHLAPVNAILFVEDNGTKMVSSSDDKKVLVWEWDIGVPIKYISDPTMHSMPALAMHPSLQFFCAQSLDNTIAVFQAGNRFALQKKKKYSGHIVSGYACEPCFSPDGQFLVSGDGKGAVFFWNWKTHKILQKFRAHNQGPAIAVVWHPLKPNTMFSSGWDGVIKMWQ